jgi:predicted TIM-barrel fold metal-dependent hydrolase
MQAAGKPLIFHMGDHRFDYSHPARLRRILELFPNLKVIAAHFGGYSMYQLAYTLLKDKNCFFDISSSLMFMEDGVAENFILKYGPERMVFGSDFPLWDPRDEVQKFLQLRLKPDQIEQIAYKTALNILEET